MTSYSLINWSTLPSTLSNNTLNSTFTQAKMDKNGNVVVIWLENTIVKASSMPLNGSFSTAYSLSNSGATSPVLVVDPNGNATCVWIENGNILTSSLPFGGTWSTAVSLNLTGGSSPSLAVDSTGNVVAIWVSALGIESKTKLFGGSWQLTADILAATGSSPDVFIGSSGTVIAVWYTSLSGINTIYSASKLISSTWSTSVILSNTTINSVYPHICVDSNGNGLAIWYTYTLSSSQYTNVILVYSKYNHTTLTWSSPTNLSTAGLVNPIFLKSKIIYTLTGTAVAVWTNSIDGSVYSIFSSYLNTFGNWSSINQIASSLYGYSFETSIDQNNNIYLANMSYDNISSLSIKNYVTVPSDTNPNYWSFNSILSNGNQNGYPTIATTSTTSNYYGFAAWISFNSTTTIIQTVTGSGSVLQPPSNPTAVQSVNNFGIFKEYYNTVSWSPSPSTITTNYIISRNNIQIDEVTPDISTIIDHNAILNGSVSYSIAAINSDTGEKSVAVTVNYT